MKKNSIKIIILTIGMITVHHSVDASPARILGGTLFAGVGLTALGQADELLILDDLSEQCNISKDDIQAVLTASIVSFGIGSLPFDGNTGKSIRLWAFRAPFIAALAGLTSSKTFKYVASKIPGVGSYLGACSNKTCQGVCNTCKIRTMLTTMTIWHYLAKLPINWLEETRIGNYLI